MVQLVGRSEMVFLSSVNKAFLTMQLPFRKPFFFNRSLWNPEMVVPENPSLSEVSRSSSGTSQRFDVCFFSSGITFTMLRCLNVLRCFHVISWVAFIELNRCTLKCQVVYIIKCMVHHALNRLEWLKCNILINVASRVSVELWLYESFDYIYCAALVKSLGML